MMEKRGLPLRNILVALDQDPVSDTAMKAALAIHRANDAHVTAIVSLYRASGPSGSLFPWVPEAIRTTIEKAALDAHDAVERRFLEATADLDPAKIHLIERVTATDTSVAQASRFFDVTVVGIPDDMESALLHPDRIALLSGRPVLAVPQRTDATRTATKAAVAWDGSRAASRALFSSMRMLSTKDEVVLITVDETAKIKAEGFGLDPKTSLERQGIPSEWIRVEAKDHRVAETILGTATDHGAEVLIMGAFEHSKFREDLFGGVTRDVLASTKIPVFLAH